MKIEYIIKENDSNKKLKSILKDKLFISNILVFNLIKYNRIKLNNKIVFPNTLVKINDKIEIIFDDMTDINSSTFTFKDKFLPYEYPLNILYEDEYLLIVNKPANMPIHPSSTNYDTTLSNALLSYLSKQNINTIHIITRLDKNTTGICIIAKHKYIQELFIRKKEDINLKKEYLALVYGKTKAHEIIDKNIKRSDNSIILRETTSKNLGKKAITEYYTLNYNKEKNYSEIRVILHTGRTHQIRVHMQSINHPLLGDDLYKKDFDTLKYINRQALHAYKIIFNHPITNKKLEITAPIPKDIKTLIEK